VLIGATPARRKELVGFSDGARASASISLGPIFFQDRMILECDRRGETSDGFAAGSASPHEMTSTPRRDHRDPHGREWAPFINTFTQGLARHFQLDG
jgi:hypothetical protein